MACLLPLRQYISLLKRSLAATIGAASRPMAKRSPIPSRPEAPNRITKRTSTKVRKSTRSVPNRYLTTNELQSILAMPEHPLVKLLREIHLTVKPSWFNFTMELRKLNEHYASNYNWERVNLNFTALNHINKLQYFHTLLEDHRHWMKRIDKAPTWHEISLMDEVKGSSPTTRRLYKDFGASIHLPEGDLRYLAQRLGLAGATSGPFDDVDHSRDNNSVVKVVQEVGKPPKFYPCGAAVTSKGSLLNSGFGRREPPIVAEEGNVVLEWSSFAT